MATTTSVEKRPSDVISLETDFTDVLGDAAIQSGNITVVVEDVDTEDDVTGDIVNGAPGLDGNSIVCQIQAGVAGKVYRLTASTGTTDLGTSYTKETLIVVGDTTTSDILLSSLSSFKLRLKITTTDDDELLRNLLLIGSEYFRIRVQRQIVFGEYTDTIFYEEEIPIGGHTRLKLNEWPVRSIKSLILRTDPADTSPITVDAADIVFDREGFIWLRNGSLFLPFPNENVVTYLAGYAVIPSDIRNAVESTGAFFYRLLTREGLTSERIGDYAYSRRSLASFPNAQYHEVPDEMVEGIIGRYKRMDLDF